jgi:hypothetical protein
MRFYGKRIGHRGTERGIVKDTPEIVWNIGVQHPSLCSIT